MSSVAKSRKSRSAKPLRIVALLQGEPDALSLWTLQALARCSSDLHLVQAFGGPGAGRIERFKKLSKRHGTGKTLLRAMGSLTFGRGFHRHVQQQLDSFFDVDNLRRWRETALPPSILVPGLNAEETADTLENLQPDIIVRVSGGIIRPHIFSRARMATLNIHHGMAPDIRGMASIQWGLVEERADWIGATIHVIDKGIDTGQVLWRGSPHLAPGDDFAAIMFKTHLLAAGAMEDLLGRLSTGTPLEHLYQDVSPADSVYRSNLDIMDWGKLALARGYGKHAAVTLRTAIK